MAPKTLQVIPNLKWVHKTKNIQVLILTWGPKSNNMMIIFFKSTTDIATIISQIPVQLTPRKNNLHQFMAYCFQEKQRHDLLPNLLPNGLEISKRFCWNSLRWLISNFQKKLTHDGIHWKRTFLPCIFYYYRDYEIKFSNFILQIWYFRFWLKRPFCIPLIIFFN